MARTLPAVVALLVIGAVAALFVKLGVYNSHTVDGNTVVLINRFNGRAFQIRNGLREPVVDSNLESRVTKLFEKAYEKGGNPFSSPVKTVERTARVERVIEDEDDPFLGNPFYKTLSHSDQFEFLKSWADSWTQPFQNRSALISASGRDKTYDMLMKYLLKHPYTKVLSKEEVDDLKDYYRLRVYGQ